MRVLLSRLGKRHRFRLCSVRTRRGRLRMAALGLDPDDIETVAVIIDGEVFTHSEAVLRLLALLGPSAQRLAAMGLRLPEPWRDEAYRMLAQNRFRFGRRRACAMPQGAAP